MRHSDWMTHALEQARRAGLRGEVPVGAVVIYDHDIIAVAGNTREGSHTPLGHAEISALGIASDKLRRWRLSGCSLYATLEPCPMCAAAAVQARIDRLVFGAPDPKLGACGSVWSLAQAPQWHHRMEVIGGICEQACRNVLRDFFSDKR